MASPPSLGERDRENPIFHVNLVPPKIELLFSSKPGLNRKHHELPVFRCHDAAQAL